MKSTSLISVIVPSYNAESFLDETLKSVLSQTYENWECIIVNDGSTDNTEEIAKKWCEKDSRFRYFYKENSGASDTRNRGIKDAKGEYIAFLDADDLYMPNFLEICLETLVKKEVDLVAPKMIDFKNTPNLTKNKNRRDIQCSGKEGIELLFSVNGITVALLCKKSVLETVGGFTWYKKAEDLHCWMKIIFAGYKIYRIDKYYAYRRLHDNSWSSVDTYCTKEVFEIIYLFKDEMLNIDINFQTYISYWLKRYILLKNKQGKIEKNIKERIKYVNNIIPNYFPQYLIYLPLEEKVRKLIALQIINNKSE